MSMSKTKIKISLAAKQLFATYGYDNTSMKLIAKEANINEITIYRHFGTKENLLQFIIYTYVAQINILDKVKSIQDSKVEEVISTISNDFIDHCFANKIIYKIQLKMTDDFENFEKLGLTKNFINACNYYLDYLRDKGKFTGKSNDFSKALFTSILGIFTAYVLDDNFFKESEVKNIVQIQTNAFINAIG